MKRAQFWTSIAGAAVALAACTTDVAVLGDGDAAVTTEDGGRVVVDSGGSDDGDAASPDASPGAPGRSGVFLVVDDGEVAAGSRYFVSASFTDDTQEPRCTEVLVTDTCRYSVCITENGESPKPSLWAGELTFEATNGAPLTLTFRNGAYQDPLEGIDLGATFRFRASGSSRVSAFEGSVVGMPSAGSVAIDGADADGGGVVAQRSQDFYFSLSPAAGATHVWASLNRLNDPNEPTYQATALCRQTAQSGAVFPASVTSKLAPGAYGLSFENLNLQEVPVTGGSVFVGARAAVRSYPGTIEFR